MTANPASILSNRERVFYLLLLIVFSLVGVFDHSLWGSNDGREGSMIWEMVHTGTWVTPIINGQHYLEKPPLLHWTGALLGHLAGGRVTEGIARLPAAFYGFGCLLLIVLFGRRMGREREGYIGAFLCASAIQFVEYSRIVLTDVALSFFVLWSFYLFWGAYTASGHKGLRYAVFILVSAVSFYAKGLLGPGFVWVSVCVFLLLRKEWRLLFGLPAVFVPVFLLVLAPWVWALWRVGGTDYLETVFWANQFGRFFTFHGADLPPDPYYVHKEPIFYYAMELPVMMLPWTLLMVAAMVHWFRRGRGLSSPLCLLLRAALLSMLAILHASSAKVGCYALPVYPVVFLMTGIWVGDFLGGEPKGWAVWTIRLTAGLLILIGLLAPLVYVFLFFAPQAFYDRFLEGKRVLELPGRCVAWTGLGLAAILLVFQGMVWPQLGRSYRKGRRVCAALSFVAAWAVVLILAFAIAVPAYDYQRTFRPVAELVRPFVENGREVAITINEERYFGGLMFYLDRPVPVLVEKRSIERFLADPVRPRGLVVYEEDVDDFLSQLGHRATRVLKSPHRGYMTEQFRLILVD